MNPTWPAQPLVVALLAVLWTPPLGAAPAATPLRSPDGRLEVRMSYAERLAYSVFFEGRPLVENATLSMTIDGQRLGERPKLRAREPHSVDGWLEPVVRQQAARLREHYNELRLVFEGGYAVRFRAYDEGVAYRFETMLRKPSVIVDSEEAVFRFSGAPDVYYPQEESFFSHQERRFLRQPLAGIPPAALASLPAIVEVAGVKLAIAESDVDDYPGLWLTGNDAHSLAAKFPPYPLREELTGDRDLKVAEAAAYIAKTKGTRTYPWRILALAAKDGDLITNSLVYLLAAPSQVVDTSWIKPGKVAWDWFNANNLYGVPFKAGINTATYEYFIDFAARHGIEYVVLDEGWYPLGDLMKVTPGMDIERLAAYAKSKNVGLILWVVAKTLEDQLEPALEKFARWGVKGIKVDFMQRDDQRMMGFYHRVSRAAAERQMLVDYHGSLRPALLTRTWPNLISTEGVQGLEWNKWSELTDPEHQVTLPFTRMLLGPMDFTPGGMRNASKQSFVKVFEAPMTQGTRCQQLAMYVVYESPLQMLADSPTAYEREPDAMAFLGPVPTVWDETRVLDARLGDFVLLARRSGKDWWVGAMTDWTPRELDLDLSFLPPGRFTLDAYEDGLNADRWASDYRRTKSQVEAGTKLKLKLAPGGGWAARLTPQ